MPMVKNGSLQFSGFYTRLTADDTKTKTVTNVNKPPHLREWMRQEVNRPLL